MSCSSANPNGIALQILMRIIIQGAIHSMEHYFLSAIVNVQENIGIRHQYSTQLFLSGFEYPIEENSIE